MRSRSALDRAGRNGFAAADWISPVITRASLMRVCQFNRGWE